MLILKKGSDKVNTAYLDDLSDKSYFSRNELLTAMKKYEIDFSYSSFKYTLQNLLREEKIARIGRNSYCLTDDNIKKYNHVYSKLSCDVADYISSEFPYLEFTIFELTQLNSFVNHQIANNVVFLSVESDLGEFVFDLLREIYPGKVLIYPTTQIYHRYWTTDMVVIQKLVTEAPKGIDTKWHTRIEKMLVDLYTDKLQKEAFSSSELPTIFEDAFAQYIVDESCLFRYAKRRGADKKIKQYLQEKTTVKLRKG